MGGNYYNYYNNNNNNNNNSSRQKKTSSSSSSFFMFSFFKSKRNRSRVDDYYSIEEAPSARRVWPSDEDRGRWPVAEPGIDRRAEDFIAKIHRNIATDSERKTVTIPSTTTATAKA